MKDDTPFILECPSCQTRYEIPISIPEGGRKVRCAQCTHVWIAQPGDEFRLGDPSPLDNEDEAEDVVFREDGETVAPDSQEDAGTPEEMTAAEAADRMAEMAAADAFTEQGETVESPDTADSGEANSEKEVVGSEVEAVAEAMAEAEAAQSGEGLPEAGEAGDAVEAVEGDVSFEDIGDGEGEPTLDQPEAAAAEPAAPETGAPEEDRDEVEEFYGEAQGRRPEVPAGAASDKIIIRKPRRRSFISGGLAAGWIGLLLGVAALGALAVGQRVEVVRVLPGSAWVFEAIGMPVNVRGLDFRDVNYSWENDAGQVVLEVHGDIVNITGRDMEVPSLVLALRDESQKEVYRWEEEVLAEPLAPGASATFAIRIPTPPRSIKSVQVRFARAR